MQKYIIKQKIGVGSFGQVYLIHDTKRNQKLALKKMKTHFSNEQQVNDLMQVKILSKLRHPNIIQLRQSIYDKQTQQGKLIFEYCQSDILKKFCHNKKQRASQIQIKKHIFQIASALSFAHSKNYIHRDLKPQNILIQQNQFQGKVIEVAKLCDFGISKKADQLPLTDYIGTRWYRAPQLLIKMKNYTKNVDVFSLGCIMAELYNLQILFNGKNANEQLVLIMKKLGTPTKDSWPQFSNWCKLKGITFGKYEKSQDPIIFKAKSDDLAQDLVQKMLVMNPKNRITAADMLKHPYFNQIRAQILARQYAAKPVKMREPLQKSEGTQSKSQSEIKRSEVSQQNIEQVHIVLDNKQDDEIDSKQSDAKIYKLRQSKQTESTDVKEIKQTHKPMQIIKSPQQRVKNRSPVYYSPYGSTVSKPGIHNSNKSQKKFDYFQTYVMGKKSQDRIHTTYELNQNNQSKDKFSSSSYHVNHYDNKKE